MIRYGLTNDTTDTDCDSLFEWQEYLAGTDPTNRLSAFAFTETQDDADAGYILRWSSTTTSSTR